VLASSAGNAVEVREAVRFLTGDYRSPRLLDVTMALCVEMLLSAGLAENDADARQKLQTVLDNGRAAEIFGKMVAAQKGPIDFIEHYDRYLPQATLSKMVYSESAGIITSMDTRALGMSVVAMGGGRRRATDAIDYSVGLTQMSRIGQKVDTQHPLAMIHANSEEAWQQAAEAVRSAATLSDEAPETLPVVYRRIS